MLRICIAIFGFFLPLAAAAQTWPPSALPEGAIQVLPGQEQWKDATVPLPPGARLAVLEGNPREAGMFTIRIELPPDYVLAPHWHPRDERVTVLSGELFVAFGDRPDKTKGTRFTAGSFYLNPARAHHYVYTGKQKVLLQITGNGPWEVHPVE